MLGATWLCSTPAARCGRSPWRPPYPTLPCPSRQRPQPCPAAACMQHARPAAAPSVGWHMTAAATLWCAPRLTSQRRWSRWAATTRGCTRRSERRRRGAPACTARAGGAGRRGPLPCPTPQPTYQGAHERVPPWLPSRPPQHCSGQQARGRLSNTSSLPHVRLGCTSLPGVSGRPSVPLCAPAAAAAQVGALCVRAGGDGGAIARRLARLVPRGANHPQGQHLLDDRDAGAGACRRAAGGAGGGGAGGGNAGG